MHANDGISDKIRSFIGKTFPRARTRALQDAESLLDSGIVDSLGILEIVTFVEGEFGITVADDELLPENFGSVSALTDYVGRKQSVLGETTAP